jgi:hypothetical protein
VRTVPRQRLMPSRQLTAPTHGVAGSALTLLLQAGQVIDELLDGLSYLRCQPRGRGILHRGARCEQLVGAPQQRAGLAEERRHLLCGPVAGRAEGRHRGESDPFRTLIPNYR